MNSEDAELPSVTNYFSRRAKLVVKVSDEEIKAATQLLTANQMNFLENSFEVSSTPDVPIPALKPIGQKRKRKVKKTISGKDCEKKDAKNKTLNLSPEVKLSVSAKRRLRKLKEEREEELRIIDEENRKLISSLKPTKFYDVKERVHAYTFDNIAVLTIDYLSQIFRLKCYETDKFSSILPKIAEQFNLKASEILLAHKEHIIKVDDTPKNLKLSVNDVLDCIPYKAGGSSTLDIRYDKNNLKISFQSSDTKLKTSLFVHKLEKMQDIMDRYSKQRDIPLDLLTFDFDGERIIGCETPCDLDMESGNIIDVQVLGTAKEKPKVPNAKNCLEN